MATEFCQKCKQAHPGRVCDYDDKAECSETVEVDEPQTPTGEESGDEEGDSCRSHLESRPLLGIDVYVSLRRLLDDEPRSMNETVIFSPTMQSPVAAFIFGFQTQPSSFICALFV
jgi:hypothetical protein